jgi:membrane fusion protein (multidrug efflux system)
MRGADWIVDGGVSPGDRVIVEGTEKVRPGMTVKAVQARIANPPGGPSATAAASAASGAAAPQAPGA